MYSDCVTVRCMHRASKRDQAPQPQVSRKIARCVRFLRPVRLIAYCRIMLRLDFWIVGTRGLMQEEIPRPTHLSMCCIYHFVPGRCLFYFTVSVLYSPVSRLHCLPHRGVILSAALCMVECLAPVVSCGVVVLSVECWTCDQEVMGSSLGRACGVETLGKFFTPMCLCHQAV